MTTDQYPPSEGPVGGNGNGGNGHTSTIAELVLIEEVQKGQIVRTCFYNFRSKSLTLLLNHRYQNKLIDSPINVDDWAQTNEEFRNTLKSNGVTTDDSAKLENMFNLNHNKIMEHYSQQTLEQMNAGQRTRKERIERMKNTPPREVSVSQALMMHEGKIRVKGMFVGGSAKVEKMYNLIGFRCGNCDQPNILADYSETRPRFLYEIPRAFGTKYLNNQKCINCNSESVAHYPYEELVSALRVELRGTETSNVILL
jgi:hypothetical protein